MDALDKRKIEIKKRNARIDGRKVCSKCGGDLDAMLVCDCCGYHERMTAKERIWMLKDGGLSFREILKEYDCDNSDIFDYGAKYNECKKKTGLNEAIIVGECKGANEIFVAIVMSLEFMTGTLSQANGEKIARAFEYAMKKKRPVVAFCASGGVRLQEGAIGLVQMAKIDAALVRFKESRLPFISVLTDPVYGGTVASFGLMGDVNIAEKNASIGFGGKMLAEKVLHEKVPNGFQGAEYALDCGEVDMIVERKDLMEIIMRILELLNGKNEIGAGEKPVYDHSMQKPEKVFKEIRGGERPVGVDYLYEVFEDIIVLRGDRLSFEDESLLCGLGMIGEMKSVFIIQNKGRSLEEKQRNNYGMTRPEGYRKASRMIGLAEKFHLPVLILLDSPGAHAGNEGEKNCQGIAISESMMKLLKARTEIVTVVVGEGCSGGALALSIADVLVMLGGAMYSVISPESYSAIIMKGSKKLPDSLEKMRFTARDLYDAGLIDEVLKDGGLHYNAIQIQNYYRKAITDLNKMKMEEILTRRYNRIRNWDKNE